VIADETDRAASGVVPWPQLASRQAPPPSPVTPGAPHGVVSFGDGWLHPSLVPQEPLIAAAERAAREPGAIGRAAPLQGSPALQLALRGMLRTIGIKVSDGEVLVTGGAQQGLNALSRALLSPGDKVICEHLTWYGAVRSFRSAGADVVGIGMDHEGVEPNALEDSLARLRPKFVYLIPSFHCPTGRVQSLQRRRQVLEICTRFRTPIVESHVYGDLGFGAALPSLKNLDTADLVIHQGSASKTISPALRLGWLVAPRAAMQWLAPAKASLDLSTPALTQATLAAFLNGGSHGRHLTVCRDALRARRDLLLRALAEHCPDLRYTIPDGGLYLWAQLPRSLKADECEIAAAAEGVAVRSGDGFQPNGGPSGHIRLCFAAPALDDVPEGARRLGRALKSLQHRARRSDGPDPRLASV
jgi:DNA-binding transcriptional MocR family regulator